MDTTTSNSGASALPQQPAAARATPTPPSHLQHSPSTSPRPAAHEIPDEPLISIRPGKRWVALNLRDIWMHRELLYLLTWRELKARYKQTVMGVVWVILQPLLTTIMFTIFFGKLAGIPSDGVPYPIFAYGGLMTWSFFTGAVTNCSLSLVANANLITKVYFPRMIIPAAAIGARLVDFAVAFLLLIALMIYYGVGLTRNIVLLPGLIILLTLLALGIGMWMAALNVRYRDVSVGLPAILQFWMFASPILYPLSFVPAGWRPLYSLNPMVGIIEGFRSALFGLPFNRTAFALSVAVTLGLLVYAAYAFRRMEKSFADLV
ncbi:MAG TPA: ABC transporter permease [Pyrinomonadaceae bacterium]|jgi:lipopolysaccharide transport system permease protein|nr:ABC transporter permease [Pyrinomonadaceae bacterium]